MIIKNSILFDKIKNDEIIIKNNNEISNINIEEEQKKIQKQNNSNQNFNEELNLDENKNMKIDYEDQEYIDSVLKPAEDLLKRNNIINPYENIDKLNHEQIYELDNRIRLTGHIPFSFYDNEEFRYLAIRNVINKYKKGIITRLEYLDKIYNIDKRIHERNEQHLREELDYFELFQQEDWKFSEKKKFSIINIRSVYFDCNVKTWEINNIMNNNYSSFTLINFVTVLSKYLKPNTYSVIAKVEIVLKEEEGGYSKDYIMLGTQLGLVIKDDNNSNINELKIIYNTLIQRIKSKEYDIYNAINITKIEIMYVVNNSYQEFKKEHIVKNINKLELDKNLVNINKTKQAFNEKILPLTTNLNKYGIKLNTIEKDGIIEKVNINDNNNIVINFIDLIKKRNENFPKFLSSKIDFYLYKYNQDKYIILIEKINEFTYSKIVYNIDGNIIENYTDKILGESNFVRETKYMTIYFNNGEIEKQEKKIIFPYIKRKTSSYKTQSNPNIGAFDIETFIDEDGNSKIYALGFATLNMYNESKVITYYLTDFDSSENLVIKCINDMLNSSDYNNHIYYTHNLGGFDVIFILSILIKYNETNNNYYTINTIFRDEKILKLTVKIQVETKPKTKNNKEKIKETNKKNFITKKITFVDSYALLPDNLDNLSKSFGSNVTKGLFPYEFVRRNTLNYIGNTPSIEYYKIKNKIINHDKYLELFKNNWSLKDETLKYLKQDIFALLEVMKTFNKYIYDVYNVQLTESLTISRLALNIYLNKYIKNYKIPSITNKLIFNHIKLGYFGGITDIYKPYGENLWYYDVNSLYPFVAKNLMPGNFCKWVQSKNKPLDLNNLFGFFKAKIETKNDYLGLLPVHIENGLTLPNGTWEGWYFSESLKFAKQNGYNIEAYCGYEFNQIDNLFSEYVDDLYRIKSTTSGSKKYITKLLLNSLLGRFGMDIYKPVTKLVNNQEYLNILATKPISSEKNLGNYKIITYKDFISESITTQHNLDYFEILNSKSGKDENKYNTITDVSIAISAAVTDYARIFMNKIKLDLLKNDIEIYYMDTDSLVINKPLPDYLVGKNLGQFKLEYKVKKGYFISSKTYCLVLDNEYVTDDNKGLIIKSKSVFDHSLSLDDFINLYNNQNVKAIKGNTKANWEKGSVNIGTKEVELDHDSYTKRTKIYDENGNWINTIPLILKGNEIIEMTCELSAENFYLKNLIFGEIYFYNNSITQFVLINYNLLYNINLLNYKLKNIIYNIDFIKYQINNCTDLTFQRPLSIILIIENKIIDDKIIDNSTNIIEKNIKIKDKNISVGIVTLVLDINKNLIKKCSSLKEAAKFTGISDKTLKRSYLNKDKIYNDKFYFISEVSPAISTDSTIEAVSLDTTIININKNKPQPVLILTKNRKIITTFVSIREAARYYDTTESVIRHTYLNKDRLFKDKYYIVRDISKS